MVRLGLKQITWAFEKDVFVNTFTGIVIAAVSISTPVFAGDMPAGQAMMQKEYVSP